MAEIVLLDGGMGQELVRRSSQPAHPQWSAWVMMHEPEVVQGLHEDYLKAGAKVVTLNSYSTTPSRFEKFDTMDQFETLQQRAIDLANAARDAVGLEAAIAGCLPPLAGSYHPELLPSDEALLEEYRQIAVLQAPHVDFFLCETMSKASEARMAATAASETGKPVWIAWTLDEELAEDGKPRLRSGETVEDAISAIDGVPVEAILFNCTAPEAMTAGMAQLVKDGRPSGGYANGFTPIPKEFVLGETVDIIGKRTDLGPESYADHAMTWVNKGARIIGGCCEVGPAHIGEMARRLEADGHKVVKGL